MRLYQILLESIEEEVLNFLKNKIKGTEWENRIYLAGGAVRDQIMGLSPKDLDFTVLGDINSGIEFSEWLGKELGNYKPDSNPVIYPRFGTSKLSLRYNNANLPSIELEFVAPRKEQYNPGSRKPEVVGGKLEDDAKRRDLTINSLLRNISTDEIFDVTGHGVSDIKNGIIRTTSNPDIIYKEDGLRLLRSIRFSTKYNFKIDEKTLNGIKKNAHFITTISNERISDELNKILLTKKPSDGIRLLKDTGLLKYIIPELDQLAGMTQNRHHKDDVFDHTLNVLSNTPQNLKTRLMALFHDIGKGITRTESPTGDVHFIEHEKRGGEIVRNIMSRLKYPNDMIDSVVSGVVNHMYLKHGEDDASKLSDKTLRKFTNKVGSNLDDILDLIHADNSSHSDESSMPNQVNFIRDRIKNLQTQSDSVNPKLPLNGNDLINMGLKPSPLFREILNAIQDAWYDNPNMTKEEAIDIANKIRTEKNINEIRSLMFKIIK